MARKVTIAGISGSGKSTFGRRLAERLGVAYVELDALHHGPNWAEPPLDEFRARVEAAMAADGWVLDGNYRSKLGDLVPSRADALVWLDPPLGVCLWRLWLRTWGRIVRRTELWSGNRESVRTAFFIRDSLFSWTIRSHARHRREIPELETRLPELEVVRLRSAREVERWLARQ